MSGREVVDRSEAAAGALWRTHPVLWDKLKPLARQMRHEPTEAEDHLWQALRRKSLDGWKFRRQHTIERFIVDFYCPEARLVIEVDGEIHQYTIAEDAARTELLEMLGMRVLRFSNGDVLNGLESVKMTIRETLAVFSDSVSVEQNTSPLSPLSVHGEGRLSTAQQGRGR